MGKRVVLLRQDAIGQIFAPRGKREALVVRLAGPNLPEDARMVSFAYVPQLAAIGIVLESAAWSDLALAGEKMDSLAGIPILPQAQMAGHFPMTVMPDPATTFPACAIAGYDTHTLSARAGTDVSAPQEAGGEPGKLTADESPRSGPSA